jgi:predicted signal transduction protein with EAL and GGDEF domain
LVALACVVLVWQLPSVFRFVPRAPANFWLVAAVALLVDIPLFIDQRNNIRTRPTLSVSLCLAIFLLWGTGPAVAVQVVAAVVTAIGQRYTRIGGLFLVARLVFAFGVAGLVMTLGVVDGRFAAQTAALPTQLASFLVFGAIWFVAAHGTLLLVGMAITGRSFGTQLWHMRDDLLVTVAAVFATTPLLVILPGLWDLLAAVPVFAANLALRERIHDELQLRRDPVTGLQGRSGLSAYIETLRLHEGFRERPFAVVVLHGRPSLLEITAGLGRRVYDLVVIELARRMAAAFGSTQVGRLSGEGFVIVSPEMAADPVDGVARAVEVMNAPMEVDGIPFRLNVYGGVAISPEQGQDLEELIGKAELAIGEANREDRTVVVYVPETATATRRRAEVITELYAALRDTDRRDEITLVYQPQAYLADGRLYGVEALVRWTHPEWGPVSPEEFVAAAETSEVIHLLTHRVIDMATDQLRAWTQRGFQVRTAVNASAENLMEHGFADEIDAMLRERGIAPHQLTVEITERTITTGSPRVSRAAKRIADLGVGLSIDDYGTGYASLQQLRMLPLTEVKIDRSYVAGMRDSPAQRAIVTSLHQLVEVLGLHLVAEGVEDQRTAESLLELPQIIGQGWHVGIPVPADRLYEEWHTRRAS